jgi:hypothetical protein
VEVSSENSPKRAVFCYFRPCFEIFDFDMKLRNQTTNGQHNPTFPPPKKLYVAERTGFEPPPSKSKVAKTKSLEKIV